MKKEIFARNEELRDLEDFIKSKKSEFMLVYGRRRIGKTYLIRNFFEQKKHIQFFIMTGVKKGTLQKQLANFAASFSRCFYDDILVQSPQSWTGAFKQLTQEIKKHSENKPFVIFLDELPWLASPKSRLLHELEYYWNTEWSMMPNVKLVVCGSAASWMLDKIVNAKGGLHNRLTQIMHLQPFNLKQSHEFLKARGCKYSMKQALEVYLTTGGVPLYLEMIKPNLSVRQNIQIMCFSQNGYLKEEFNRIFSALFSKAHIHQVLIEVIAKKASGMSRRELSQAIKIELGGRLSHYLSELESAGFIKSFTPYGNNSRDKYYRVIDEYSLFYLRWIQPITKGDTAIVDSYWTDETGSPAWHAWAGFSFEVICLKHFNQIRKAIGIDKISCRVGSWRFVSKDRTKPGAQIDLLFDRNDGVISIIEIKNTSNKFVVTKDVAMNLSKKSEALQAHLKTDKQIMIHLVSAQGLKENAWSEEILASAISLEGLFQ